MPQSVKNGLHVAHNPQLGYRHPFPVEVFWVVTPSRVVVQIPTAMKASKLVSTTTN
jgi:hypothetical protein